MGEAGVICCKVLQDQHNSMLSDVADSKGGIIPPSFAVQNTRYSGRYQASAGSSNDPESPVLAGEDIRLQVRSLSFTLNCTKSSSI